jgi:hypothetical protein
MASVQALSVDSGGMERVRVRINGVDGPPSGWTVLGRGRRAFRPALYDSRGHDVWVVCRRYDDDLEETLRVGEAELLACSAALLVRCSAASMLDRSVSQPQLAVEYVSDAPLFPQDADELPSDLACVPQPEELLVPVERGRRVAGASAQPTPESSEASEYSEEWSDESSGDEDETMADQDESLPSETSDREDDDVEPPEDPEDDEDLTADADFAPQLSGSDEDDL